MAVHQHKNQDIVDLIGADDGATPYQLTGTGEAADLRRWSRAEGLRDGVGDPIDPAGTVGVRFQFARANSAGTIFARSVTVDAAGTVTAVGPEAQVVKAGSKVFAAVPGGIQGRKDAPIGEKDEFFERTAKGLQARTDFLPDSETEFMKAGGEDDLDVELKPDSGG